MTRSVSRPYALLAMLAGALVLLSCTGDSTDSSLQSDPDAASTTTGTPESPTGQDSTPGDADGTAEGAGTPVAAQSGDDVVVEGVIEQHLSDQVITLTGFFFESEPAEEVVVVIPTSVDVSGVELEEGAHVGVTGRVARISSEGLANIDPGIFDEHGEVLEGFRAQLGILATEIVEHADEEGTAEATAPAGSP